MYETDWIPYMGKELCGVMEEANLMDKSTPLLLKEMMIKYLGIFHWESQKNLQRQYFTSLKQTENILEESTYLEKAVSAGDGLGMKVPSRLPIFAEEKYINILKEKLSMLL